MKRPSERGNASARLAVAFLFVIPPAAACSGTSNVDRNLGSSSPGGSGAAAEVDGGAGVSNGAGGTAAAGGAGGAPSVGGNDASGGITCTPISPMTDSGTCPVMPPGGVSCTPPQGPTLDCGNRGACIYPSGGTGIPERICRTACADDQGNCPPAESVCTPIGTCVTAADCQGTPPQNDCVTCPLAADGTPSTACAHWVCLEGKCNVGYCESSPQPVCSGGHGCPSYYFPSFDKSCGADSDCDTFNHFESCCSGRMIGVSTRDKAHAAAMEAQCTALLDQWQTVCGCPFGQTAEDGTSMPQPGQAIVGACIAGTCKAVVRGGVTCGTTSCAENESCCSTADASGHCTPYCGAKGSCPSVTCVGP